MKMFATAAIALASILGAFTATVSAAPPARIASAPRPKFVDLDQLPAQVDLVEGQQVFFKRGTVLGTNKKVSSTSKNLKAVQKNNWPHLINGTVYAGYQAASAGKATVEIETTVVAPGARPSVRTLNIVVHKRPSPLPRPKAAVIIDLSKPLPKNINLRIGQQIVFQNGKGTIAARDTDNKGQLLESRPHNTFNQVAAFRAKRTGNGEITVTLPSQGLLTVVWTRTIKVTVK